MATAATLRPASRRVELNFAVAGLVAITVVGALIRFWTLGRQSYWLDESTTLLISQASFHDMAVRVWNGETTPPLYYVAAWLWVRLFGHGEAALRSLSALAGTLTIPAAYAAARALVGRRAGLLAAALASVSPLLVWYSQEARAYSFLVLFSAASFAFFARAARGGGRRDLAGWGLASALALASHYFAVFVVVPEALWLVWRAADRRAAGVASAGVGLAGLAIAPIALHQHAGPADDWIAKSPLGERLHGTVSSFATGIGWPSDPLVDVVLGAVVVAVAVALLRLRGERRDGALIALGIAACAIVLPLALAAAGADVVLSRNLLPAWIPLAVAVAAGLATASTRGAHVVTAFVALPLLAIFLHYDRVMATDPTVQRDDWRSVAAVLGPPREARAVIVTPGHQAQSLVIYLPGAYVLPKAAPVTEVDTVSSHAPHNAAPPALPRLNPAFRETGRRTSQRMTIVRYRAAKPTRVASGVAPTSQVAQPPVVLLQPR